MLEWLIRRRLAAFEARWHYPMDYARALLAGSRRAFFAYARLAPAAALREGLPLAAWHAAKITALRAEECGPCTQLAVDMARAEGVPDALLQALLDDDLARLQRLDADAALTQRFAHAWARREAGLPAHREALRQRFGEAGLATLAVAMTSARMFPLLKSALGHAQHCQRVQVEVAAAAEQPPRLAR
ncbi:MAG: hypothetical protein HY855_10795 [Burkholderiales bacterium]|nr:hypothetical protein [Burkholderiales bacterium]